MKKTYEEVKKDLKELHKINRAITVYLRAKQNREDIIKDLKATGKATVNPELMEIIDENLKKIRCNKDLNEWARLENLYLDAINELNNMGQRLITQYFLNGLTYKTIAKKENYSHQNIQKIISQQIRIIRDIINNK